MSVDVALLHATEATHLFDTREDDEEAGSPPESAQQDDERISLSLDRCSDEQPPLALSRVSSVVDVFEFEDDPAAVTTHDESCDSRSTTSTTPVSCRRHRRSASPSPVRQAPVRRTRPALFASSSTSSLQGGDVTGGVGAAVSSPLMKLYSGVGGGGGGVTADGSAVAFGASRRTLHALSKTLVQRLGELLTRQYRLEQVVEHQPQRSPSSSTPLMQAAAAASASPLQRCFSDSAVRSQSATDPLLFSSVVCAAGGEEPPRVQLASVFMLLRRVNVECAADTPQPCMRCGRRVDSGRAALRLSHAVAVNASAPERVLEQRCIVEARLVCFQCALQLADSHYHVASATSTPQQLLPAIRTLNLPFLANRFTRHVRYTDANGANAPMASVRAQAPQPLRCVRCASTVDPQHNRDFTVLLYRRADCNEVGVLLVCSAECEQIFRVSAAALSQNPLVWRSAGGSSKAAAAASQQQPQQPLSLFDWRYPSQWRLLSVAETLSQLQAAAARPHTPFPAGTVLHQCRNPSCWCVVKNELAAAAAATESSPRPRRSEHDGNSGVLGELELDGIEDYAWLRRIADSLTHANLYEDILSCNDDMLCATCRRPTEKRCARCRCTHFCSEACRHYRQREHVAHECEPPDAAWGRLFYC